MYICRVSNKLGSLVLTQNEAQWQVISITGLNPPKANINTTTIAGMDGAKFNSSYVGTRNIVITIRIQGDVETNRLLLYRMFRTKEPVTFFYQHNNIKVFAEGYVDSCECNMFKKGEQLQASIICPYPYLQSVEEYKVDISHEYGLFQFPFSINDGEPVPISSYDSTRAVDVYNDAETDAGMILEVDVEGSVSEIMIAKVNTGEYIDLQYSFLSGDKIIINTNKGQKRVTLIRNNVSSSIFGAVQSGSTFFQLDVGQNKFEYTVTGESADIELKYRKQYRGV